MFSLKNIIYDLFGYLDKYEDLYKDVDQKGLHQRFNELLAQDLDDNEIMAVNLLVENTQNPFLCLNKFIPYRESSFGMPSFSSDLTLRRKFISFIKEVNRRKGTKSSYEMMFSFVGITAVLTEIQPTYGFDSAGTFDDSSRVFDQKCKGCSGYELELTASLVLTPELLYTIGRIVAYCEPINARLLNITYNINPITIGDFSDDYNEDYLI